MPRSIAAELVDKIKLEFDDVILEITKFQEQTAISFRAEHVRTVCEYLKNEADLDFNYLVDLGGVHYPQRERQFEVVYHFYSLKHKHFIRMKAQIAGEEPQLASVSDLWRAADWLERETYDMFGIVFSGHKNLKRIYLDDSWVDFPLRKDYPLEGKER